MPNPAKSKRKKLSVKQVIQEIVKIVKARVDLLELHVVDCSMIENVDPDSKALAIAQFFGISGLLPEHYSPETRDLLSGINITPLLDLIKMKDIPDSKRFIDFCEKSLIDGSKHEKVKLLIDAVYEAIFLQNMHIFARSIDENLNNLISYLIMELCNPKDEDELNSWVAHAKKNQLAILIDWSETLILLSPYISDRQREIEEQYRSCLRFSQGEDPKDDIFVQMAAFYNQARNILLSDDLTPYKGNVKYSDFSKKLKELAARFPKKNTIVIEQRTKVISDCKVREKVAEYSLELKKVLKQIEQYKDSKVMEATRLAAAKAAAATKASPQAKEAEEARHAKEEQERVDAARLVAEELKSREAEEQRKQAESARLNAQAREVKLAAKAAAKASVSEAHDDSDSEDEELETITMEQALTTEVGESIDVVKSLGNLSSKKLKFLNEMLEVANHSTYRHRVFKYADIARIAGKLGAEIVKISGSGRVFKFKDVDIMMNVSYGIHEPHDGGAGRVQGVCVKIFCDKLALMGITKEAVAAHMVRNAAKPS